jgi:hypothetical protein
VRIDDAIDRLAAAHREHGLPGLRPPADPAAAAAAVERIVAEIAPLRLPADLARLWQRVDPSSLAELSPYPHPSGLVFALEGWMATRDDFPGLHPLLLFPFGYEDHGWLLVELEDGAGSGGPMYELTVGGPGFTLVHPGLCDYLELRAEFVEQGRYAIEAEDGGTWLHFDPDDAWPLACVERAGGVTTVPPLAGGWPEPWLAADGIGPETVRLRGADTTVRDLLADRDDEHLATIRGRVVGLFMTGDGTHATVDDGTGVVEVRCPPATRHFGPVIRGEFEFDVVVRPRDVLATALRPVRVGRGTP